MKRIRTNRRRRMKLKNFVACITALSVVMGSSYFAMAEEDFIPNCGIEAHTHTDACYGCDKEEEWLWLCGATTDPTTNETVYGQKELHTHTADCGDLTCAVLDEGEEENHQHSVEKGCYYIANPDDLDASKTALVCGKETEPTGHVHSEACTKACDVTTHNHAEGVCDVATCTATEHSHDLHANECNAVVCDEPTEQKHNHSLEKGCYYYPLQCENPVGHVHTFGECYTLNKEKCDKDEHKEHTDDCKELAPGSHSHTQNQDVDPCTYTTICGKEYHEHVYADCVEVEDTTVEVFEMIQALTTEVEEGADPIMPSKKAVAEARAAYGDDGDYSSGLNKTQREFVTNAGDLAKYEEIWTVKDAIADMPVYADVIAEYGTEEYPATDKDKFKAYYAEQLEEVNDVVEAFNFLTSDQQKYITAAEQAKMTAWNAGWSVTEDVIDPETGEKTGETTTEMGSASEGVVMASPEAEKVSARIAAIDADDWTYAEAQAVIDAYDKLTAEQKEQVSDELTAKVNALREDITVEAAGIAADVATLKSGLASAADKNTYLAEKKTEIEGLKEDYDKLKAGQKEYLNQQANAETPSVFTDLMDLYRMAESKAAEGQRGYRALAAGPNPHAVALDTDGKDVGINFHLFDYSYYINQTSSAANGAARSFVDNFSFRGAKATTKDDVTTHSWVHNTSAAYNATVAADGTETPAAQVADGTFVNDSARTNDTDGYVPTRVQVKKNLNGYSGQGTGSPYVVHANQSLAYLFSEGDHAVTAYTPNNTILQKDSDGYYRYNSAENAVDYDIDTDMFLLRDYVERAGDAANYYGYGDFLPFTYWDGVTTHPKTITVGEETKSNPYNYPINPNYWFGMTMDASFVQPKDGKIGTGDEAPAMEFKFSGDDDVWVFIDGVLVLDLGGTHGTVDGYINFATGEIKQYLSWGGKTEANTTDTTKVVDGKTETVYRTSYPTTLKACFDAAIAEATDAGDAATAARLQAIKWNGNIFADNTQHDIKFFYLERGSSVANCKLDFNLLTLPPNTLTIGKELEAYTGTDDETAEYVENTVKYRFRIVDENGESLYKDGDEYTLLASDMTSEVGTRDVGADGSFELKAGQYARFDNMLENHEEDLTYYVQELLPEETTGQYDEVHYEILGEGGNLAVEDDGNNVTDTVIGFDGFMSGAMNTNNTNTVVFTNSINTEKLGKLEITKEATADTILVDDDGVEKVFDLRVKLGGSTAKDLAYKVKDADGNYVTDTDGDIETYYTDDNGYVQLKAGQTAVIEGILAGTTFEVAERNHSGFTPVYEGVVTVTTETTETGVCNCGTATEEHTAECTFGKDVTTTDTDTTTLTPEEDSISGTMPIGGVAVITVTNESDEFEVPFIIAKTAVGVTPNTPYKFFFDIKATDAANNVFTDFEVKEVKAVTDNNDTHYEKDVITTKVDTDGDEAVDSTRVEIPINRTGECTCTPVTTHADDCALKATPAVTDDPAGTPGETPAAPTCTCGAVPVHTVVCDSQPNVSNSKEFRLVFDDETPEGTYTFTVTEYQPAAGEDYDHALEFVYDKTVHTVTVVIDQDPENGNRATATGDLAMTFVNGADPDDVITKIWSGDTESDRPESITINVYRDGKLVKQETMTKANKTGDNVWTLAIDYIDSEDAHNWTITEEDVDGYNESVNGFTVTNTKPSGGGGGGGGGHKPEPKPDPKPTPDPEEVLGIEEENIPLDEMVLADEEVLAAETGDSNHIVAAVAAMAAALAGIFFLKKRKEN